MNRIQNSSPKTVVRFFAPSSPPPPDAANLAMMGVEGACSGCGSAVAGRTGGMKAAKGRAGCGEGCSGARFGRLDGAGPGGGAT